MRLAVGPLPSSSVQAWMDVAVSSIEAVEHRAVDVPFSVGHESMALALDYFAEWQALIDVGDTFTWETEADPDAVMLLVRYWHNISRAILDLARDGRAEATSAEGEEFADQLLRAILDGLVAEERLDAATAARMWAQWPRLSLLSETG